jgi:hypothetical protein
MAFGSAHQFVELNFLHHLKSSEGVVSMIHITVRNALFIGQSSEED